MATWVVVLLPSLRWARSLCSASAALRNHTLQKGLRLPCPAFLKCLNVQPTSALAGRRVQEHFKARGERCTWLLCENPLGKKAPLQSVSYARSLESPCFGAGEVQIVPVSLDIAQYWLCLIPPLEGRALLLPPLPTEGKGVAEIKTRPTSPRNIWAMHGTECKHPTIPQTTGLAF